MLVESDLIARALEWGMAYLDSWVKRILEMAARTRSDARNFSIKITGAMGERVMSFGRLPANTSRSA